ncbi:hypothetical protein [Natronobeatus ordinarius]|uniref:hypothetical protein n=1 Tax=Natronobeatus ordinarius TaxID=2963433 RepID=UPI0020CBEF22|nr:hypothetical protein [Natronobeatus ordinarius]
MGSSNIPISRRTAVKSIGAAGIVSLAGCMGDDDGDGNGTGSRDGVETISIEAGGWPPENSYASHIFIYEYFDEINRILEENDEPYEIEYTWHSGGSVVGAVEGFYGVRDGIVDMAFDLPTYYGTEMALAGFLNNPFIWPVGEADAATQAFTEMVQPGGYLSHYWEDLDQYCLIGGTPPGYQLFSQEEITSLDQLEGMVIRSGGGAMSLVIEELGGSPVETTAEETYETLQSGTADGAIYPQTGILDASLHEVTDFKTTNLHLGGFPLCLSISQDKFNSMPESVQDVFLEVGTWTGETLIQRINDYVEENIYANEDWFADERPPGGNQLFRYESPIREEIHATVENLPEEWIQDQEAEGRNGEEFRDHWIELMEKYGSYYPPAES